MENGQSHKIKTDLGEYAAEFKNGDVKGKIHKMDDGSLLVPAEEASKTITNMLRKEGFCEKEIADKLDKYWGLEENVEFPISEKTKLVQRPAFHIGADLKKELQLDPLVCIKVAYEFLALLAGEPILADKPALNNIRDALRTANFPEKDAQIEILHANLYHPFHGLLFEGNNPHAVVQIRLFGKLAYKVHFFRLKIDLKPIRYTHDLKTNSEDLDWVGNR